MATSLHTVLTAFETGQARSLAQLSAQLDIAPPMLESMLMYWVRKGKLREVNGAEQGADSLCVTCGSAKGCPFIMKMPRMYELVREGAPPRAEAGCGCRPAAKPARSCCH